MNAIEAVKMAFNECRSPLVNDVTCEHDGMREHVIVTLDLGTEYRIIRLDVTDLGVDPLDHDEEVNHSEA